MSNDLVAILRNYIPGENDEFVPQRTKEAAAEIERLRAEVADLTRANMLLHAIVSNREEEISGLRAQLAAANKSERLTFEISARLLKERDEARAQLASARNAAVQEAIDIAQRYDDCGAQFIIEKLQSLSLSDEKST